MCCCCCRACIRWNMKLNIQLYDKQSSSKYHKTVWGNYPHVTTPVACFWNKDSTFDLIGGTQLTDLWLERNAQSAVWSREWIYWPIKTQRSGKPCHKVRTTFSSRHEAKYFLCCKVTFFCPAAFRILAVRALARPPLVRPGKHSGSRTHFLFLFLLDFPFQTSQQLWRRKGREVRALPGQPWKSIFV